MSDSHHFENGFIAISQLRIIHFQWDLVCRCRFSFWKRTCDNYQSYKFKIETAAILKIVFGYISTIYCAINAKFATRKHNHDQTQVTWPNSKFRKY